MYFCVNNSNDDDLNDFHREMKKLKKWRNKFSFFLLGTGTLIPFGIFSRFIFESVSILQALGIVFSGSILCGTLSFSVFRVVSQLFIISPIKKEFSLYNKELSLSETKEFQIALSNNEKRASKTVFSRVEKAGDNRGIFLGCRAFKKGS